jgi:hypothetical protein
MPVPFDVRFHNDDNVGGHSQSSERPVHVLRNAAAMTAVFDHDQDVQIAVSGAHPDFVRPPAAYVPSAAAVERRQVEVVDDPVCKSV